MYPYDFVAIDWQQGVERRSPAGHHRFSGLSGRLVGEIETLTPFFIPEQAQRNPRYNLVNLNGDAVIPGSSLKGLVRSLVETIGPGCWWLFDGEYNDGLGGKINYTNKLPKAFHQCPRDGKLCVACRMFGLIQGDTLLLGHVGFDDAVCSQPREHPSIYTIILGGPKPRHDVFYLDPAKNTVAGRKFYFHHSIPPKDEGKWLPDGAPYQKPAQNSYIKPLEAGNLFTFSGHFNNLSEAELRLLLYALVLEPGVKHKLGYGKPAGLGSVSIRLIRLELINYRQRYRTAGREGKAVYEGETLHEYLQTQTRSFVDDQTSITLRDLRRIWAWPGRDDLRYPSWGWFQDAANAKVRLADTP